MFCGENIQLLDEWYKLNTGKIHLDDIRVIANKCDLSVKQVKDWLRRQKKKANSKKTLIRTLLEKSFKRKQSPSSDEVEDLVIKTGLSRKKIIHWFANKRIRFKKQKMSLQ